MKDEYIIEFYNEVKNSLEGEYKIILEPGRKINEEWIEYDKVKWEIEDSMKDLVQKLVKENKLTLEQKILKLYEFICLNYIYDVNVLYFFKKDLSDPNNIKYIAVDWYGRIVGSQWIEKRKKHNRRICYEFARFYAKAINELITPNDKVEAFMLGDKENLHYVVGLSGEEYSAILDLDDFNNIKDLTRVKAGLTAQGINILDDENGKFGKALDRFNDGKAKNAIKKIESEVSEKNESQAESEGQKREEERDDVIFLRNAVEILANTHNIDSQGIYEYMKEIVDIRLGPEGRKKVWKKLRGDNENSTRYVRCLVLNIDNQSYIIDVDDVIVRPFDKKEFEQQDPVFIPYKDLNRDWDERYDGS